MAITDTQYGVEEVEYISMATKHAIYTPIWSSDGIHDSETSPEHGILFFTDDGNLLQQGSVNGICHSHALTCAELYEV